MHLNSKSEVRCYQSYRATSRRVDETYVKVGGKWKYLFRAVDKHGLLIDFMLTDRRNTRAAYRFLGKALMIMRHCHPPRLRQPMDRILKLSAGCSKRASCQGRPSITRASN
nr:DDE-type integrase/transposase/recombinase [Acidisarcina polymorpha]